ncbi:MAG: hypothetical protein H3C47_04545 [Candidatus Cloacimonetes bacterium]|nr:hypothetical protein [Candidatus Cloacimonadota bacterium]
MEPTSRYAGLKYLGELDENGLPHGKGKLFGLCDVDKHEHLAHCNFVHGHCQGYVEIHDLSSKVSYIGYMQGENVRHGYGKYIDPKDGTYEGNWANDRKSGFGINTDKHGNQYIGEHKDNHPHGNGKIIYKDSTTYYGDWVDGLKEGNGILVFANGDYYIGEFKSDKPEGIGGTISMNTGKRIFGEFKDFRVSGLAIESNTTQNTVRIGEYKNDTIHGLLVERAGDGKLRMMGQLNGFSKSGVILDINTDGTGYIGEVKNAKPHGRGILTKPGGLELIGNFENGVFINP